MAYASVRAAAQEAAKKGTLTPHQLAALTALDESLTDDQKRGFTELWRSSGSPAAAPPKAEHDAAALAPLLALIRAGEGSYDSINRGRAGDTPGGRPGLSTMTLAQVMGLQSSGGAFAVGAYQFIPDTLKMAAKAAGVSGTAVFNDATQDRLAIALLLGGKRPALRDYLTGKANNLDAAQIDLAKEWASIPQPNGRGLYDGDSAGNRATAKAGAVREALQAARRQLAKPPQLELPAQQPGKFTPNSPFSFRVTPHITYGELALGQEARRFRHQYQCDLALELCQFLEKARAAFGGKPVIITSAHRPAAINAQQGGASRSEHLYSGPGIGAIDFYIEGVPVIELQKWADRAWPYSLGLGAPKGFIHVGKRQGSPRLRWDY